jgi:nucleolar MIF4G domain-containing protein 1
MTSSKDIMMTKNGKSSRKQRRKEERMKKRKRIKAAHNRNPSGLLTSETTSSLEEPEPQTMKRISFSKPPSHGGKKERKRNHVYGGKTDSTLMCDAIRRDEEEIAELEAKLGISKGKKSKDKLYKEFAVEDGFGEDFVNFLLDDNFVSLLTDNKMETNSNSSECTESSSEHDSVDSDGTEANRRSSTKLTESENRRGDEELGSMGERNEVFDSDDGVGGTPGLHPSAAEAIRKEEGNILELEARLGVNGKQKKNLNKIYAEEGFGDDFGDFLVDLDDVCERLTTHHHNSRKQKLFLNHSEDGAENEEDVNGETPRPKEPARSDKGSILGYEGLDDSGFAEGAESEYEDGAAKNSDSPMEPDHDKIVTYRPRKGEDIYGNRIYGGTNSDKPSKYVPPHLRKKTIYSVETNEEQLRAIRRALNTALNRLSEDSLISVSQELARLYRSHPTSIVHEAIWDNVKNACVSRPMLMTGLIPIYVGCMVGVHLQSEDTVQLGEHILEATVVELCMVLDSRSSMTKESGEIIDIRAKQASNLMLILCYLYNYNLVHCSLIYDVVRRLIESFSELDVECLLIILSHAGKSLRSDDPSALKEIVLSVQKRTSSDSHERDTSSSRVDFMVSAILDLKNNRRSKQDSVYADRASKIRKLLGRIKSSAASSGKVNMSSQASLRIRLEDILNAETKGRWWKVGASWVGNQYRLSGVCAQETSNQERNREDGRLQAEDGEKNKQLLQLATKMRINSDRKRAIFCIIMGGTDCDDVFEKLCRGGMLQNRSERDTVRVLMQCCGHEKSYNKFYGHLAVRICEYQPQCRFSFQLAFWDVYKQFELISLRRSANLAKLLFNLVAVHNILKMHAAIKTIDMSDDELPKAAKIFLTIFFCSIFSHFEDPVHVKNLFALPEETLQDQFEGDGLPASLLYFLLETLKASPANTEGSKFRSNFKAAVKALDTDGLEDNNMF